MKIRVGFGYDVHALVPDRALWLGGIKIEHTLGLQGHSDADVLIHVGIDTVEMKGKGFKQLVQKGDKVTAGQELLDFNIDEIKKNGYDPTVVMIVTNSKDFLEVLTVLKDKDATKEVTNQDNVIILA